MSVKPHDVMTSALALLRRTPGSRGALAVALVFAIASWRLQGQGLDVFLPAAGDWSAPGNWSGGGVPGPMASPDILNGGVVTVHTPSGSCSSIFVGQGDQAPTGTVLFRPGAALTAANLLLGRDGANQGRFNQSGGSLTIQGTVSVGDGAGGGAGAGGEYNLSAGLLVLPNAGSSVVVGNRAPGRMLVAGSGVLSAPSVSIGVTPAAAGSKMFQWGGTIHTGSLTIGAPGVINPSLTLSAGGAFWSGELRVYGKLEVQGSKFWLQRTNAGGMALHVLDGGVLRFDLDAQGVAPVEVPGSVVSMGSGARVVVDGSRYARWNSAPGEFPLIHFGSWIGPRDVRGTNFDVTGFGDLTAVLRFTTNSLDLVLSAPSAPPRLGRGLFCEYWEVPIMVRPGVPGRSLAAPLAALPEFSNSLAATHPIFGRVVPNVGLDVRRRDSDYFLRFSGDLDVPAEGAYTFWLNSDDGSKLWIDGAVLIDNDGVHAPVELAATTALAAGMHSVVVGYFQGAGGQALSLSWAGPGFSRRAIPDDAFFLSGQTRRSVRQPVYQNIVADAEADYNYAPSFLYDELEGLYKIWMCGNGIPGAVGGDNIFYREAPSLEGLMTAPLTVALQPSLDPAKFDQVDACDPCVFRVGSLYYMAYGGNTDGSGLASTTRIGMAVSRDGGRTFQRLHGGEAILEPDPSTLDPNAYGIGQPAVAQAPDGFYYMIYTDVQGRGRPDYERVVRSSDPSFSPGGFTPVVAIPAASIGGFSLDLGFDDDLRQFVVLNQTRLLYFDEQWRHVRTVSWTNPFAWSLGEGYGLLMNTQKRPVRYSMDGVTGFVVAGSTVDAAGDTSLWAPWVAGDLKYIVLPQAAAPVIQAIPDVRTVAGAALALPIPGSDPNAPPLALTYSLDSGPAGATLNAATGQLSWRSTQADAGSTHEFVVRAADSGIPPLETTRTFTVRVVAPRPPALSGGGWSGGAFSLTVDGDVGPDYAVEATASLTPPVIWRNVATLPSASPPFTVTDSGAASARRQFYRVRLGP